MNITNEKETYKSCIESCIQFDISDVQRQTAFQWELSQEWLNAALDQCEYPVEAVNGDFRLNAEAHESSIQLRGEIRFQLKTDCNTCLRKVLLDLSAHIDTFMQSAETAEETQDEITPEDLDIEYYTGTTIVLDDLVRDSILLELPMIPRCSGTCQKLKGLVTADELELRESTVDPRLQALADIKLSKEI